ncbi:MAG: hypothetical protein R3314_01670 [Longimicrobiales bacterium]|nr:hypothetical protein [Longimicrobiales bacterium]
MVTIRRLLTAAALLGSLAAEVPAQASPSLNDADAVRPLRLSGPRFGLTYMTEGIRDRALEFLDYRPAPVMTQFGWQWETRFFSSEDGATGVSEWVLLVGGLEQSLVIPSLTWIVGFRSGSGVEFGVGPNVTMAGAALVAGGGVTLRSESIFFPINLAVVPSRSGTRISILAGFNMRRTAGAGDR